MANDLLENVLEAHGGLENWRNLSRVEAAIVSGGELWAMKRTPQDDTTRHMAVSTKMQWASLRPYGAEDQYTDFTADRIAILRGKGDVVAQRLNPAEHAEGKAIDAPWDALDRAYFNGYALWTYLTTPFFFAIPGVSVREIPTWHEEGEEWRGLRVTCPAQIATPSREQDFYFGSDFLLRRHDYHVEASGDFAAAQYVSDLVTVNGFVFPTKRRAFLRDDQLRPVREHLMVSIDLSEIAVY